MEEILLVLIGALAGFAAGLLGIGGGILLVPALYLLLPTGSIHIAVGTSLAASAIATAFSSWFHAHQKKVNYSVFWKLVPTLIIGCLIGVLCAHIFPSKGLRFFFGTAAVLIGGGLFLPKLPLPALSLRLGPPFGLLLGILSSLLGIGGGIFSVPFLIACQIPVGRAIATSSLITFISCTAGGLIYLYFGLVDLRAVLFVGLGGCFTPWLGVKVAHYSPVLRIRRIFAVVIIVTGLWMILS